MTSKSSNIKLSTIILYVSLTVTGFICVAPFIYIISASFTSEYSFANYGVTIIPRSLSMEAYRYIFQYGERLYKAIGVSLFVSVVGTFLELLTTAMLAYPLSRTYLPFRTTIMKFIFFTMLFSGGLIPTYLLVRWLGLLDNLWALVLPGLVYSWNMILMRNFFMQIPRSLEESALCDGANDISVFFRIILPTSKTILATIGLFYAVGNWNSWFPALLYISDSNKYPAMLFLRNVLQNVTNAESLLRVNPLAAKPPSESVRMACVVIITAPIVMSYPFAQKYFVKGVMIGSIKG